MTFAEILLFLALAAAIYQALRPLQRRLEKIFLRWVTPRGGKRERTVIDIDDRFRN